MQVIRRRDPLTGRSLTVEIRNVTNGSGHPLDDYREVKLHYDDGPRFGSTCWKDPMAGEGPDHGYWWEEPGMIILHDLTPERILAAVDDIVQQGAVTEAFLEE
jgi:hypothetical protein